MHITRTNPSQTEAKLLIQTSEEELKKAKQVVLTNAAKEVKVPGFRTGHVPPAVAEKQLDPNLLQSQVMEEAVNRVYAAVIRKEKLRPVGNPEVAIKKFVPFTELELEFTVQVIGDIKLPDYKKIKVKKQTVKLEPKEIDDVLASLRARAANRKSVDRPAKSGDEVVIDFKGTDAKGEPVQGAEGKEYPLALGSNAFIPGFEDNLIGIKPSEEKNFTVPFPKDYGVKALQNKKVTFTVKAGAVNELELPDLNDDFAAAVGPFKSLDELKKDIERSLLAERERQAQELFESELLEKLAAKTSVAIPDILINEQIERIEAEEKRNVLYRGQTWEEHLKEEGVSETEHKEQKRPAAEQRVKIGILLTEISEAEGVQVTAEEIQQRLSIMKAQYRDPSAQAELNKPEALRDIQARIATEKTLAKLSGYAGA